MQKIPRIFGKTVFLFFFWSVVSVIGYRFVPVYFTPLMGIRMAEQIAEGRKPEVKHKWVPYRQISVHMKRAVLASEDQRFLNHSGFDKVEIKKALKENKTRNRPRGQAPSVSKRLKTCFSGPGRRG